MLSPKADRDRLLELQGRRTRDKKLKLTQQKSSPDTILTNITINPYILSPREIAQKTFLEVGRTGQT